MKQIITPSPIQDYRFNDYFYHKKSFFELHGQNYYDVVFIGDSITDGAEWQDLFPALKIANRGISGDTTKGLLMRLDSIISTSAHKAFIMIGGNDFFLGSSVDEVYDNYQKIVNELVAHDMLVYIQSTVLHGKQFEHDNETIMKLNARLQSMSENNNSITYIDLNSVLAPDSLLENHYSLDGIHLTGYGYVVWKKKIGPHVSL